MRRTLTILTVLTLAVGVTALAGCSSGRNQCPTICQPSGTYEHVVSERCFPIDRNGNPLYRQQP
jgi:hypothetical protein